ncbi:hypothetical protein [Lentilitoribacter sp. Alg239-R112]|uniref:hypothetical protein n=1 Tax=Lentilitoribacter sp. Alg239-R112 TaxID=2305987 RepID=UPI0013A7055B|nr:hypothetical protein [Lentilitoribacter sp. Alg239-R112]
MPQATLTKPSLTLRIGLGKLFGLAIGLAVFLILPLVSPETSMMFRWGILFWYTTLGAIIGVFGVYTEHPILGLPLPWWVRATGIGAWMNLILTMLAFDELNSIMSKLANIGMSAGLSPFWFVAEGAIVGFILGWLLTKLAGEGPKTLR